MQNGFKERQNKKEENKDRIQQKPEAHMDFSRALWGAQQGAPVSAQTTPLVQHFAATQSQQQQHPPSTPFPPRQHNPKAANMAWTRRTSPLCDPVGSLSPDSAAACPCTTWVCPAPSPAHSASGEVIFVPHKWKRSPQSGSMAHTQGRQSSTPSDTRYSPFPNSCYHPYTR